MSNTKILIIGYGNVIINGIESNAISEINRRFPECEFRFREIGGCTEDDYFWADVVTGRPAPEMLKKAANIKWFHLQSAGADGYNTKTIYANPNIIVTRSANVYGIPIAEHTIGMMLSLCRRLPEYIRRYKNADRTLYVQKELYGSVVLMLGTGNLADEIIKRLSCFNCEITGIRRDVSKPSDGYSKIYSPGELHTALSEADFIVNTLPLTPDTRKYLGSAEFDAMKRGTILINVGRGGTVDTNSLVEALKSGCVSGAGLDVTDPEPLDTDSPLWDMDNVILTHHTSTFSPLTGVRRFEHFCTLLQRYLDGKPLGWEIDFNNGY